MNINLEEIAKLAKSLSPWVSVGEAGVGIVLGIIEGVKTIRAREGRAPTGEELHQLALSVRADFEALPKPK
jgi:hypothetical protein